MIFTILLLAFAGFAWSRRFVLDDAFISFRYAQNLVEGRGLVWNPGERVEGYSNFLWTLLLTVPLSAGLDPVMFCHAIGPVLSTITLCFTGWAAILLCDSRSLALLAVLLTGSNPTFAAFATGGLETMLGTALQMALICIALRAWRLRGAGAGAAAGASILSAACLLTRLDAAIAVGLCLSAMVLIIASRDRPARAKAISMGLLLGPGALILAAWFAWKLSYYGRALPNTFEAKLGAGTAFADGFSYLRAFFTSTLTVPFLVLIASWVRRFTAPVVFLAAAFTGSCLYLAAAGGDFMEFRLLVPSIPIFVLLIVWAGFRQVTQREVRAAILVLVLAGWIHHGLFFDYTRGIETIDGLARHVGAPGQDWAGIGKELGRLFGGAEDLWIATSASGAIPYYSRLPAIDMLGLTDPWIPAHGIEVRSQPGHVRAAPFSYLIRREVNLVLGHPWILGPQDSPESVVRERGLEGFGYIIATGPGEMPPSMSCLIIPIGGNRSLVTLYLKPHPAIEEGISAHAWRRIPLLAG